MPNLVIFIFSRNFAIRQIWGCWFQTWHNYFQIPVKKYPNKPFLVPNLGISVSSRNLAIRKIRGCWFQIWQYSFAFICIQLVFCISPNSRILISNITLVFQIYGPNYPNKAFLVPFLLLLLSLLLFCPIFGIWINSRVLISNMAIIFQTDIPKLHK